jgi:hypothetical protein
VRIILLGGVVVLLLFLIAFPNKNAPSLDRLADRVERLAVIPAETRKELSHLIERVSKDSKGAGSNNRNATAAARIERAMQFKQ